MTLAEAFDTLREFHKRAPFLFFNGNTFAAIGRELSYVIFGELPMARKREVGSNPKPQITSPCLRESLNLKSQILVTAAGAGGRAHRLAHRCRNRTYRIAGDVGIAGTLIDPNHA
jgi:hypothetical protein